VLLALFLLGGQLATWLGWPIPGGVMGLALLLMLFATGVLKPATLQLGAGWLMAEMLLFFIPALMSLLTTAASAQRGLAHLAGDRREHPDGDGGDRRDRGTGVPLEVAP
jgi:putative effector of murein hydrolase LrgA (UPF0299 family)